MGEKLGPRRTAVFRVSFTHEMGERIERIAGESDLYASTLIREIVEVYVIEHESRMRMSSQDTSRIPSNSEKLREDLIKLNEEIMSMIGHRTSLQMRLKEAAKRESEMEEEDD